MIRPDFGHALMHGPVMDAAAWHITGCAGPSPLGRCDWKPEPGRDPFVQHREHLDQLLQQAVDQWLVLMAAELGRRPVEAEQ